MKFLSYAQNFEDLMLWRALGEKVSNGFYIDVGANDPVVDSITKYFYDNGWRGINVEPLEKHWTDLCIDRPNDINLCVAVGDHPGELTLWDFDVRGWGTADSSVADNHNLNGHAGISQVVPVTTLKDICLAYAPAEIHFLKVDVEGLETSVLKGADFEVFRPWIVIVESTLPNSREQSHEEWENILLDARYEFRYFDGLNRFYVASEHPELNTAFELPPNVFDEFKLYGEFSVRKELTDKISENAVYSGMLEVANCTIAEQGIEIKKVQDEKKILAHDIELLKLDLSAKLNELSAVESRLHIIESSKTWRLRNRAISFLRKIKLVSQ
ncbi:FkbM family methyltransferase [Pseudomonas sp. CFBP 8758]|uniref:FkbM family methyltransferase n=1 Tax=Pseudomonas sp. CFBP 8758 TaxID=2775286 RepID=UPI00177D9E49|nr:FkbM family methyltransferase [Pseudomonas sp. CFBP 8758]MBD8595458.1 FkbM family methyltransferase [Pseudomonas sp. CFBP 8758]